MRKHTEGETSFMPDEREELRAQVRAAIEIMRAIRCASIRKEKPVLYPNKDDAEVLAYAEKAAREYSYATPLSLTWTKSTFEVHVTGWGSDSLASIEATLEDAIREAKRLSPRNTVIAEVQSAEDAGWEYERSRTVWTSVRL